MNETTILEKRPTINGQKETKKEGEAWKHVTLGGVSGILMGAGLLYAGQAVAQPANEKPTTEGAKDQTADVQVAESNPNEESVTKVTEDQTADVKVEDSNLQNAASNEASVTEETEVQTSDVQVANSSLHLAASHDGLSFGEAFAAARAEVGPGGVFYWHGGIYNTYIAEEWNAMTPAQKHDFAQLVQPQIDPHHINTPTDAHPNVTVHVTSEGVTVDNLHEASINIDPNDGEVHIVGRGGINIHASVAHNMNNDGNPDVNIIDVNDDNIDAVDDLTDVTISDEYIPVPVDDLTVEPDPNLLTAMDNPEVAPDMPDYMNDANIDDMNVLV